MNYYDILEINDNASDLDIKKAYFKQIRIYPPDKSPEQFKKIREAYEYLKVEENRVSYKKIAHLDSFMLNMYQTAIDCIEAFQFGNAADLCKEAITYQADHLIFYELLVKVYLENEEFGKAVKSAENLVHKDPGSSEYRALLAYTYEMRGFTNKALRQYGELYQEGYRNSRFLVDYMKCTKLYQTDLQRELALEVITQCSILRKDNAAFVSNAFEILFNNSAEMDLEYFENDIQTLMNYVEKNNSHIYFFEQSICHLINVIFFLIEGEPELLIVIPELIKQLKSVFSQNNTAVWKQIMFLEMKQEECRLKQDERIGDIIKHALSYYFARAEQNQDDFASEFGRMQTQLEMIEMQIQVTILSKMPKIKKELDIVKAEYPFLGKEMKEFIEEIEKSNNIKYMHDKIEKKLQQKFAFPNNRMDKEFGDEEDYFASEEPYRRKDKKIGRNDPCPCGSGKKYKHCCGKL